MLINLFLIVIICLLILICYKTTNKYKSATYKSVYIIGEETPKNVIFYNQLGTTSANFFNGVIYNTNEAAIAQLKKFNKKNLKLFTLQVKKIKI